MYFDAVVDNDHEPLFNGTTPEVLDWLSTHMIFAPDIRICVGQTLGFLSVEEYIREYT